MSNNNDNNDNNNNIEWSIDRVRNTFIEFFKSKDHSFIPSSGVYLPNDDTLLFVNAGMNQFKPIFLGTIDPSSEMANLKRAVNSQKCIRAGGKHNDLEDVGRDSYHHTMFEMLGSWSFGDYFKKECIEWAWELLTKIYKLDPDRLYVTYFGGDKNLGLEADLETKNEWLKYVSEDKILSADARDNFWEMGKTGPCGPCSEIHYDKIGNGYGKDRVNKDDPLVIEIWNLVFMQYNKEEENGKLKLLPAKHCDTGMGLERLTSILQNKLTNYEIDIFSNIFEEINKICINAPKYKGKYNNDDISGIDTAYRIVADHIRTITFAISDGVTPSNIGRGYVIRRIIRRAVCNGVEKLGVTPDSCFFSKLAPFIKDLMKNAFPELNNNFDNVINIISNEENQFGRTLRLGLKRFNKIIKDKKPGYIIPGDDSAKLFHTFGFPFDLTRQKALNLGFNVDKIEHKKAMEENQGNNKDKLKKMELLALHGEAISDLIDQNIKITDDSLKYNDLSLIEEIDSKLLGIWCGRKKGFYEYIDNSFYNNNDNDDDDKNDNPKNHIGLIFNKTQFYAEQGGQIYDTGLIYNECKTFELNVESVQVYGGYIVHYGTPKGFIKINDKLKLKINISRRKEIMNNHTTTHLINFSLRKILGNHIDQQGSLVLENKFRFDFSHNKPLTEKELENIEENISDIISKDLIIYDKEVKLEKAKKINGVRQMFGEKYPDPVRIVSIGVSIDDLLKNPENNEWNNYPIEFCGGTHIKSTKFPKLFTIISEDSISKGIRRVVCLTGNYAENAINLSKEFEEKLLLNLKDKTHNDLSNSVAKLLKELNSNKEFPYAKKIFLRNYLSNEKKKAIKQLKHQEKQFKKHSIDFTKDIITKLSNNDKKQDYLVTKINIGSNFALLKTVIKNIQKIHSIPIVLFSLFNNKLYVVAFSTKEKQNILSANVWINEIISVGNGKGGGKSDSAQGVCQDIDDTTLQSMLNKADEFAKKSLS